MTTLATTRAVSARPRLLERMLLAASRRLEAVAMDRIRRRSETAALALAQQAAAERARDRGYAVHQGLLPR